MAWAWLVRQDEARRSGGADKDSPQACGNRQCLCIFVICAAPAHCGPALSHTQTQGQGQGQGRHILPKLKLKLFRAVVVGSPALGLWSALASSPGMQIICLKTHFPVVVSMCPLCFCVFVRARALFDNFQAVFSDHCHGTGKDHFKASRSWPFFYSFCLFVCRYDRHEIPVFKLCRTCFALSKTS